MSPTFSTEDYLTSAHEHSGTRLRTKCKRLGMYCLGLSLLVGSWGTFFVLGYQYNQSINCNSTDTFIDDI